MVVLFWPWFRSLGHCYGHELEKQGMRVLLVTTGQHFDGNHQLVEEMVVSASGRTSLAQVFKTRRMIQAMAPDWVIYSGVKNPTWLGFLAMRGRSLEAIHDVHPHDSAHELRGLRLLTKYLIRKCVSGFIVFSQACKEELQQSGTLRGEEIVVWPLVPEVPLDRLTISDCTNRSGFLLLGRYSEYKGFDLAIKAWNQLPEHTKQAHPLRVLCSGRLPEDLRAMLSPGSLTERVFTWQEAADAIRSSLAVLLPYRAISQSGVQALAAGLGTRVIHSDLPGLNEYATDIDLRVADSELMQWSAAMQEAIERPRHRRSLKLEPLSLSLPLSGPR